MVGNVLQDLRHQHQASFDVLRRLLLNDAHLKRGNDGRVDEPQEHDGADGADVALLALRESFA
jgi:hypothetical protein